MSLRRHSIPLIPHSPSRLGFERRIWRSYLFIVLASTMAKRVLPDGPLTGSWLSESVKMRLVSVAREMLCTSAAQASSPG